MPFAVPIDRLRAKIEAWPLRSQVCFDAVRTDLPRWAHPGNDRSLLDSFGEHIRSWAGGMSLEGIDKLRELAWFAGNADRGTPEHGKIQLPAYLANLANRHLELHAKGVRLRWHDGDEQSQLELRGAFQCARSFRWLTLHLPADLLVAALTAYEDRPPRDGAVSLITPALKSVLDRPVAQSHLHVGAAIDFPRMWTMLMARLALPGHNIEVERFERGGPPPFYGSRAFCVRLVEGALVRLLLASFLQSGCSRPLMFGATGETFLRSWIRGLRGPGPGWTVSEAALQFERTRDSLCAGNAWASGPVVLQRLYQRLTRSGPMKIDRPADVVRADPLFSVLFPMAQGQVGSQHVPLELPEAHFTHRALQYLMRTGSPDPDFVALFWQYQRIRCATYGHITQEPGTSGLDWFTRHYDRIGAVRGDADDFVVSFGLAADGREANLAAYEVRTSPSNESQEVAKLLRSYAQQAARYESPKGIGRPEFGVVLHFLKQSHSVGLPQSQRRRGFPFGRYSEWYLKRWREAQAIETALQRDPRLLLVFRGIDVCNVELGLPVWPLLELFDKVRRASQVAAERLASEEPLWQVEPIRATCHVGEEYRRLMEGLRHMHEVVFYRLLHRGDRVGHGLALAHDPEHWAAVSPVVAQPREDRLDDLLWELDRYAVGDIEPEPGRIERAREEVRRHATYIYDDSDFSFNIDDHREARRYRHQPSRWKQLGFPYVRSLERQFSDLATSRPHVQDARPEAHLRATRLLHRYLKDYGVWLRGREPIEVPVEKSEVRLLTALQRWLRNVYAKLEITIESNPSSNLVVADYRDTRDHPAFVLRPVQRSENASEPPLAVSINTDDPVTFATTLADEYAHLYFAMLDSGVCAEDARAWLDQARECGWNSRFTLAATRERATLEEVAAGRFGKTTR